MTITTEWTQERIDQLRALAARPNLSTKGIAREMGITASAVIGKIHRLGLNKSIPERAARSGLVKKRAGGKASGVRRAIAKRAAPVTSFAATAKTPERFVARSSGEAASPCSILDLTCDTCRWPFGDPRHEGFHFCGGKVHANGPYCGDHAALAWVRRWTNG